MPKEKKKGRSITCFIEESIYIRLTDFCADSGMSKTGAVERALTVFMNEYYKRQEKIDSIFPNEKE